MLFNQIRKSIQAKTVIGIVVGLLLSLTTVGALNFYNAKNILTSEAEENLIIRAEGYAREIEMWQDICKAEVAILASNPVILNGDTETALQYLNDESKRNPLFLRFWLVNTKGQAIHSTGDKTNIADREYFKQVMQTGQMVVTDPLISKADGKMVISIVAPLKRNNQVIGVLGGTVTVDSLIAKLNEIKVGQSGYAYMIQGDGVIISHPDKNLILKSNPLKDEDTDSNLKEITTKMVNGEEGIGNYNWQGATKYIAYVPVPGSKWSLAINVPRSEILTKLTTFSAVSLGTIAIILLIACAIAVTIARKVIKPILALNENVEKIAQGNLTREAMTALNGKVRAGAEKDVQDELETLAANFCIMVEKLRDLVQKVLGSVDHLASSSEELTANASQSSQAASQVACSVAEVAEGAGAQLESAVAAEKIVEDMHESMQQAAVTSAHIVKTVEQTSGAAENGNRAVTDAEKQMQTIDTTVTHSAQVVAGLGERSREIGQIIDTISGIAGQTNLLALNAAIEAARAGEQGRGFAVVAEEVRKLAEQSQDAAKHIAMLIGEIQEETEKAVTAMADGTKQVKRGTEVVGTAGQAFAEINSSIEQMSSEVKDIAGVIADITEGNRKIVSSVKMINQISKEAAGQTQSVSAATEEQTAAMEEIAASSQALAQMAEELRTVVSQFKI